MQLLLPTLRHLRLFLIALATAVTTVAGLSAQSIIVTDPGDNAGADCTSGSADCTFRSAIELANTSDDPVTIGFASEMEIQPGTEYPEITSDNITITGLGPAGTCDGELVLGTPHDLGVVFDGSLLTNSAIPALKIDGSGSSVIGVVIQNFPGHGIRVSGASFEASCNYIGTSRDGSVAMSNGRSGIVLDNGADNSIIDNNLLSGNLDSGLLLGVINDNTMVTGNLMGTDASGTSAIPNDFGIGNFGGRFATIGGTGAADHNVISGNKINGFNGGGTGTTGHKFFGNIVGMDINGTAALGNGGIGISTGTVGNEYQIGGPNPDEGNLISANQEGVVLANDHDVLFNLIGTDINGNSGFANTLVGIRIRIVAVDNVITGNLIDGSPAAVTTAADTRTGHTIRGNMMRGNGIGIDHLSNGVSEGIDADDADEGPNNLMNPPTIFQVSTSGSNLVIKYCVEADAANAAYPLTVDFYEAAGSAGTNGFLSLGDDTYSSADNDACDPASPKEVTFPNPVAAAKSASAMRAAAITNPVIGTSTDADGNTSEFSGSVSLPVELVSFEGFHQGDLIELFWTTATENDNAGFEIQSQFDGTFSTVGFVAGSGNSVETTSYTFSADAYPGINRFRLKQIDFDGSFEYSAVLEIDVPMQDQLVVGSAFPNPTDGRSSINVVAASDADVRIQAVDALGRVVKVLHDGPVVRGERNVFALETDDMTAGVYFLHVRSGRSVVTRPVVVR